MTHFSFKMAAVLVSSLLMFGLAQAEIRAEKREAEQDEQLSDDNGKSTQTHPESPEFESIKKRVKSSAQKE
ncbi:hypothetical protein AZI87_16380 [Bdellovibrio bacteriovorus]|uniref:Secreted protein n=1 Tax=Bdellovibrio bacteriovorus TaxID=959 RepID=A0A161PQC7_BDEBC|nr:hypothetical protein [Bdellovibrio bacteriovorus]KYG62846.1 hypothetical protein AZI87_16380 [Bdellovibrio bacteriovorus]